MQINTGIKANDKFREILSGVIGHIDEPLGLAGALVTCDDLNHGKRLLT